jgi:5-methylcytosine-specific restriction endonuclease McrA
MPMERDRYPANWNQIATAVKEKAGWCCEFCGKPCRRLGEKVYAFLCRIDQFWIDQMIEVDFEEDDLTVRAQRFTLTVAHLDQNPGNNAADNLKALCFPCHLKHDAQFLMHNRMQKRERQGQLRLEGVM